MDYLYIVATKKEVLVTIRIAENVRDEFKKAAELRIGDARPRELKPKLLKRWQALLDATDLSPTTGR